MKHTKPVKEFVRRVMIQPFFTSKDVFRWMDQICIRAIQPGLERMEWLLQKLDYPERRCKFIHIAGTNGKGSTSAMIASVLQEAGYSTGLFVSPSVVRWNERIQVDGEHISDSSFVEWANKLKPLVEEMSSLPVGPPSPFEFYTTLALCYFAFEKCPRFIVWETGLGGRLDATNVVTPLVSVITRIGLDHQDCLGSTIQEIAREKAGIIKPGVPIVCCQQLEELEQIINTKAATCKSTLYQGERDFFVEPKQGRSSLQEFTFNNLYHHKASSYAIPLFGVHQLQNAATALMTLDVLRHQYATIIERKHIEEGLRKVKWPGRIEKVGENPLIILDGAHNKDGMKALLDTLQSNFSFNRIFVMVAMMRDKEVKEMLSLLLPFVHKVIATELSTEPRSYLAEELQELIKEQQKNEVIASYSPIEGMKQLQKLAGQDDLILITGSLYLVSEVRAYLLEKN